MALCGWLVATLLDGTVLELPGIPPLSVPALQN